MRDEVGVLEDSGEIGSEFCFAKVGDVHQLNQNETTKDQTFLRRCSDILSANPA